jgi:DNA-binding NtrC family response regulator
MGPCVLIIDDEIEVCLSLRELLEANGFEAAYSTRFEETDGILSSGKIDLILLDIRMPEISGIDLLKIIRRRFPSLPIIIISGHATVDTAVKAMKYGASNLFTKPIEFSDL